MDECASLKHNLKKQGSVVAQLVERWLPIPAIRSSNQVIGKVLHRTFVCWQLYWKNENKLKKEAANSPIKKLKCATFFGWVILVNSLIRLSPCCTCWNIAAVTSSSRPRSSSLVNWSSSIFRKSNIDNQWIRLRLQSCHPGFESQAYHQRFYHW